MKKCFFLLGHCFTGISETFFEGLRSLYGHLWVAFIFCRWICRKRWFSLTNIIVFNVGKNIILWMIKYFDAWWCWAVRFSKTIVVKKFWSEMPLLIKNCTRLGVRIARYTWLVIWFLVLSPIHAGYDLQGTCYWSFGS